MAGSPTTFGGAFLNATLSSFNGTSFLQLGAGDRRSSNTTTEAQAALKLREAGTLSRLTIQVAANATNPSGGTYRLRVNSANVNQTIAITGNTTGAFQDLTHTDSISSGDLICSSLVVVGGSAVFILGTHLVKFVGTTNTRTLVSSNGSDFVAASTTKYFPLAGGDSNTPGIFNTTENDQVQHVLRAAADWTNLQQHVVSNTSTNAVTVTLRKNGANGNNTVSLTAATTGLFEDTTHTDSMVAGDVVNGQWTTGSGTSNTTNRNQGVNTKPAANAFDMLGGTTYSSITNALSNTVSVFAPIIGFPKVGFSATEADCQVKFPFTSSLSRLRCSVTSSSGGSGSATFTLRRSGSNLSNSVSLPTATTGRFEDSSHADAITVDDVLALGFTAAPTSANITIAKTAITANGTTTSTETGTGALAFDGIAFVASGTEAKTAAGTLAFGALAFAGTGTDTRIATGELDFSGLGFAGSGAHGFSGSGSLDFSGIKFSAKGGSHPSRITQLVRLVAAVGEPDARVTQAVRMVPAGVEAKGRVTQAVRLMPVSVHVQARVTQAVRLLVSDRVPCVTRWTQLWRITRRDGEVFRYTALDEDFLWGDELFATCGGALPSAAQDVSAIGQVSNQELQGIFKDDGITEAALYGGLFDDAFVEVWLVAYEGTESPRRLAAGWTGNLSHEEGTFNMEVVGPGAKIDQQALVQVFGPGCRWVFGSPECGYNREARKITGTVSAALTRGTFIGEAEVSSGGTGDLESEEGGLQWSDGLARWITGPNAGLECEVKTAEFESGGIAVELWDLAAYLPGPGDEFELLPGCDLSFPTCRDVYHNAINFGGFKDVPGQDAIMQTPDAKVDS